MSAEVDAVVRTVVNGVPTGPATAGVVMSTVGPEGALGRNNAMIGSGEW